MPEETPRGAASNPFTQGMAQAKTAMEEFTRMFAQMNIAAVPDMELLLTAHQRNMEALSQANRIALEGAQAVAKRHMEIMQQTMDELSETLRSLGALESTQAKAARQAELLKRAYERAVSNAREIGDLIQHSNSEAVDLLNKRFTQALDEVKTLMEKANANARP